MPESFLKRWARLKSESEPEAGPASPSEESVAAPEDAGEPAAGPSLREAQLLTPDADFSRFVGKSVDPGVRRAALKTLFSDPHFQQMDGLDIYIGDYTQPSPLSAEMVAALWHSRSTLAPQPLYRVEAEQQADQVPATEDEDREEEGFRDPDAETPPETYVEDSADAAERPASPEGTPLPFNEHVNFSHGSEPDWNRSRSD